MLTAVFLVLACSPKGPVEAAGPPPEPIVLQPSESGPRAVPLDRYTIRADGLQHVTLKAGEGPTLASGDTASVHYTGWLLDGTVFDSSLPRGEAFTFKVGGGQVIKGWDQGVVGMQVGEQRQLVIPSPLGYGAAGAGSIPPRATLVFEVELLAVQPARRPGPAPDPLAPNGWAEREDGARVAVAPPCEGAPLRSGERVRVEYSVWLTSGKLADSTYNRAGPETAVVGGAQLVPGLMRTLQDMSRGCSRVVALPADLAYGGTGSGAIPPYTPTNWQITVVAD